METNTTRLNKYIAETGLCSRREADQMISEGRVLVNGMLAELGTKVREGDEVSLDGKIITPTQEMVYLAFHKPRGIICTTETDVKDNIIDYINYPVRIFPIGRLDRESEGLIFMTNDGDIVNKILRAGNNHEKEYIVTLNKPVTAKFIREMSEGVPILDTVTRQCIVEKTGKHEIRIILTQGLNRQIRRMCEYLDFQVTRLIRKRIMNIHLGDLVAGKFREFTKEELDTLHGLLVDSSKTEEASDFD